MKIFLFPGQGSQFVGMGKSLVDNFPIANRTFEEASDALGKNMEQLCFDGPESELKLTQNTQPCILTHSIAAYRVLAEETGVSPDFVAGHSLGEYSALVAAGALPFVDAVRLVEARGKFMQEAVPAGTGAMAALIGAQEAHVASLCSAAAKASGKTCEMANFNGGGQIVISGHKEAVEEAVRLVGADPAYGISRAVLLPVSAPFHCSLMKPAAERMRPLLERVELGALQIPYIANVDAKVYGASDGVVERLLAQISGAVRWEQSMQLLSGLGVTDALEIGPGKVLSGLMRRIDKSVKCKSVDTMDDVKGLA